MRGMNRCTLLLIAGAALAACGSGTAANPTACRSGTVSVTIAKKPVTVCVKVGAALVMHGGRKGVDGYWPGQPTPSNSLALELVTYSSTGLTPTAVGGQTPTGSQPSASIVEPGTMSAHFKALNPGTAKITVHYVGNGEGYPLDLTVKVVP